MLYICIAISGVAWSVTDAGEGWYTGFRRECRGGWQASPISVACWDLGERGAGLSAVQTVRTTKQSQTAVCDLAATTAWKGQIINKTWIGVHICRAQLRINYNLLCVFQSQDNQVTFTLLQFCSKSCYKHTIM